MSVPFFWQAWCDSSKDACNASASRGAAPLACGVGLMAA
jgi:hypothetical protein